MSARARGVLVLVLYALTFRGVYFGGNMQRPVVDTAAAIVEWGRLDIGELWRNTPDSARYQGRYYSGMSPGASILAVPVYATAKLAWKVAPSFCHRHLERAASARLSRKLAATGSTGFSLFATPFYKEQLLTHAVLNLLLGLGGGAAQLVLIARLAERLGAVDGGAHAGAAIVAGTALVYYASAWSTQSVALIFLLLALDLGFRADASPGWALLAGVAAGVGGSVDYPYFAYGAIALVGAALGARTRVRALTLSALGLALPLALVLWYHTACFGGPFSTPYHHRTKTATHVAGIGRLGFGQVTPSRVVDLVVGPREGLLWLAPAALLGVAAMFRRQRDVDAGTRALRRTMTAIVTLAFLYWIGIPWPSYRAAYGPRYFLVAIPLLCLLARPSRVFLGATLAGLVINHLNLIGVRPVERIFAAFTGLSLGPPEIHLFPYALKLDLGKGLAVDLLYQACIVAIAVVSGAIQWRRRGRQHESSPPAQC